MKYFFTQDESCHWYMVPVELRDRFNELMELSDGNNEASDLLGNEFDQYRTGGGIDDIEFEIPGKKILYYGDFDAGYEQIFLDQDKKLIATMHENDGNWRGDYFNPIIKHFGIEVRKIDFDKIIPKKLIKQVEAQKICSNDINFAELKIK